ncbi:hypothetical protein ACFL0C_01030 [Patescibacteria group bacterium]
MNYSLLIHMIGHAVVYVLLAFLLMGVLNCKSVPWKNIGIGLIVTIFLDTDHLIDYFIFKKWLYFNVHEFLTSRHFALSGYIYIPFHAWEWVLLVLLVFLLSKRKYKILLFIALGIAAQLIFDTISHGFDPKVYFISYRYLNNFTESIFH